MRILIVDDQALMREGLRTLLEAPEGIEVVGEAEDGVDALEKVTKLGPDVALVDVRMPRMNGVELAERLSAEHPRVAVVILITFDDDEYVAGALGAGARLPPQGHPLQRTGRGPRSPLRCKKNLHAGCG